MYDVLDLDFNNDGVIDASDLVAITDVVESEGPPTCETNGQACDHADFNRDGDVNADDISTFTAALAKQLNNTGAGYSVQSRNIAEYRFLYRGYWYDQHLGIYHVRHRAYDPRIQRWLQPDPAMFVDGLNRYAYCGNRPFSLYDPMGLDSYAVGSLLRSVGLDAAGEVIDDMADGFKELSDSLSGERDASDSAHAESIANMIEGQARHAQDERRFTVYVHLQMSGVHAVSEVRAVEDVLIAETAKEVAITAATGLLPVGKIVGALGKGVTKLVGGPVTQQFALSITIYANTLKMGLNTALGRGISEQAARAFFGRVGGAVTGRLISKNSNEYVGKVIVYEIFDRMLGRTYKFGESARTRLVRGVPIRIQEQLRKLKKLYPGRMFDHRVIKVLDNKLDAKSLERTLIEDFYDSHGCMPEGNKVFR